MITVVMTTYFPEGEVGQARFGYAHQVLNSLMLNLKCDRGFNLHISDDGSSLTRSTDILYLMNLAKAYWESMSTISDSNHQGIGASLNKALDCVDNLWMYTTDDWLLTNKLNLDGPVALLENRDYDLVRLGPIHPDLECMSRFDQNIGWWLDLHQHYGGFAFATRPFIAKKSMFDKLGPFDELANSYETERLYAERVAKSTAKLAYWGGVDLAGPWQHLSEPKYDVGYKEVSE